SPSPSWATSSPPTSPSPTSTCVCSELGSNRRPRSQPQPPTAQLRLNPNTLLALPPPGTGAGSVLCRRRYQEVVATWLDPCFGFACLLHYCLVRWAQTHAALDEMSAAPAGAARARRAWAASSVSGITASNCLHC